MASRITKVVIVGEVADGLDPVVAELESEARGNRYGGKIITDNAKPTFVVVDELNPIEGRGEPFRHTLPLGSVGLDPQKEYKKGDYVWVESKFFPHQAVVPLGGGAIPYPAIPTFPPDFMTWIKKQLGGIPVEHIQTSMIRFTDKGLEILFTMPETPEMVAHRVTAQDQVKKTAAIRQEKEEIAQFRKLYRKYGNRDKSVLDDEA